MTDKHGKEITRGDEVRWGVRRGRVRDAYPHDAQGFAGTLTVDMGGGCYEYWPPRQVEVIDEED